ncbi:MAG: hypothetical protein JWR08_758 [Enterovirga sp.]|nr:hypothetical protein [Enterovirga sp.]
MIEVTHERPGPDGPAFIELTVRADENTTVFATWTAVEPGPGAPVPVHAGATAKPVHEAWDEAMTHAERNRIGLVVVDDPGRVFPAEDFGLEEP